MDFFGHQDQARKLSSRLIVLFVMAVLSIIVLLNLLTALTLWGFARHTSEGYQRYVHAAGNPLADMPDLRTLADFFSWQQWLLISAAVITVIGLAALTRWLNLRRGGRIVAESLGGKLLQPNTEAPLERRLLNVVEEMALASGMPVPPVYVLPDPSINAFAAGYQASDAVIGVTRGCMEQLSRDQLQGVIAHEFSHILNGDMRLNIRLMAALFGILFIALSGRVLVDISSSSRGDSRRGIAPLLVFGLGLIGIGYIGVFFGNLIKSAVSRQREFLADASAVQFTRNPDSIAGALKVIGYGAGSHISSPEREETAHLFFGEAMHFSFDWFATHPPLADRIRRIQPRWDGRYLPPQAPATEPAPSTPGDTSQRAAVAMAATAAVAAASADLFTGMARQTSEARALVLSLLLAPDTRLVHDQQLDMILKSGEQALYKDVLRTLNRRKELEASRRLALVEQAIPALKQMSEPQYRQFSQLVVQLAKADGQIDLFEWCLYRLLLQYLGPHFDPVTPAQARYSKPEAIRQPLQTLLSWLAHYGHDNSPEGRRAAQDAFNKALPNGAFGGLGLQLEERQNSLNQLNKAIAELQQAYPHIKARIIKTLVACAHADGQVRGIELDLIRTLAVLLESPIPTAMLNVLAADVVQEGG